MELDQSQSPTSDDAGVNAPTDEVREEHRFFERDGKHLYRADFLPQGGATSGVILCAPFAEEKIRTMRIYVSLARQLARRGLAAICFDYYGDGDSEGDFEDATFDDRLADIEAVYRDACEEYSLTNAGLFGLRWGGTLATLASEKLNPAFLILWEPVVDTTKYFFDHLRSHIASQMLIEGKVVRKREALVEALEAGEIVTVEGYNLTGSFFGQARNQGLSDFQSSLTGPVHITQLAGNPARIRPELEKLAGTFRHSQLVAIKREFEWEKTERWRPAPPELFGITIDFLKTHEFL